MKFGLLKDIKPGEYRTIVTPAEVEAIVRDGHEVYVQRGAGAGAGFADEQYAQEGAKLVDTMEEIYGTCDFVTKVKELEPCEFPLLRENQIVLTCTTPPPTPRRCRRCWTASASRLPPRTPTGTAPPTVRRPASWGR